MALAQQLPVGLMKTLEGIDMVEIPLSRIDYGICT